MKPKKVIATIELKTSMSLKKIKDNLLTLFEIYDKNKVLQIVQIQLNVVKK